MRKSKVFYFHENMTSVQFVDEQKEEETTFISACHSVHFDAPVSHICNCVFYVAVINNVHTNINSNSLQLSDDTHEYVYA